MTWLAVDYASPSAFDADRSRARLGLTANARRPVRFCGRIRQHIALLRFALQALGEAIWSREGGLEDEASRLLLDPIITVHPDRVFIEAFSQDKSSYVRLSLDPALFDLEGAVDCGTTTVDFSGWLWGALGEMRSSRVTEMRIETAGFPLTERGAGGRFENKVELPNTWVRGLLQVQSAMTLPGTCLSLRPVDLLAAIRFLRYRRAKVSPRALRYEMQPGQDARIVLEPWEEVIPLRGAEHGCAELRTIRTWGRHRLELIEPLLPFADRVRVYLKGRGLPSFYAVDLPGMSFLLGLSGFAGNRWTAGFGSELMSAGRAVPADELTRCIELLSRRRNLSADQVAAELGTDRGHATLLLDRLTRQGRVMFDLETREYRHRELFEVPVDEAALYPFDPRLEQASAYLARGMVQVAQCQAEETRRTHRFKTEHGRLEREVIYRDWRAAGQVGDQPAVTVVMNDSGQVILGECGCNFFRENLLSRGPCAHMLALYQAMSSTLQDPPSSAPADHPPDRMFRDPRTGEATYGGKWGSEKVDKDDDASDKDE
jgi:hypothetical protein